MGYPQPTNGLGTQNLSGGSTDPLSPDSVTAAAMSVVRQQMIVAAAQHHSESSSFHIPSHLSIHTNNANNVNMSNSSSLANLNTMNSKSSSVAHLVSPTRSHSSHTHCNPSLKNNPINVGDNMLDINEDICQNQSNYSTGLSITRINPSPTAHDLRIMSPEISPPSSPKPLTEQRTNLTLGSTHESAAYKSIKDYQTASFTSSETSSNEIISISRNNLNTFKDTTVKLEPMTDCRSD